MAAVVALSFFRVGRYKPSCSLFLGKPLLLSTVFSPSHYISIFLSSQYILTYCYDVSTQFLKFRGEKNNITVETFLEMLEIFLEGPDIQIGDAARRERFKVLALLNHLGARQDNSR